MPEAGGQGEASPGHSVRVVHDRVPGRLRLHVPPLRRCAATKQALERGLAALPGVLRASANAQTGNVLVLHEPELPVPSILRRAAACATPGPSDAPADFADSPAWHSHRAEDVAAALASDPAGGLDAAAARQRLADAGPNRFSPPAARGSLAVLAGQFANMPVLLLAGAAAFSVLTGGAAEGVAIIAVLLLNGTLGFAIESRSERTIGRLEEHGSERAQVMRDGISQDVPLASVVPGDLLLLRRGTVVPADARLVSARDLTVSEALLTGESMPVHKRIRAVPSGATLGDRLSMVYRGTLVTGGNGSALAVATGAATEVGRIQRMAGLAAPPQTPMQRQLDGLGRKLFWLSLGVCGLVTGVGALRGLAMIQLVRSAVSLAVAAIPEGLPTVATTSLAIGVEEMRRRDVLVRRLDALETLASVRVICFDKTGTLTLNHMAVTTLCCSGRCMEPDAPGTVAAAEGDGLRKTLEVAALCSDAEPEAAACADDLPPPNGSATETALLDLVRNHGVDVAALRRSWPRLSVRYRTRERSFMVTTHRDPAGGVLVAVKGNPDEVLELCSDEASAEGAVALTPARREAILRDNARMAGRALRVIGFAFRKGAESVAAEDLTWLGLAGMADPIRPGIERLIRRLHAAGIHTVMMTGDQVATARAIATRIGLAGEAPAEVVEGAALPGIEPPELARLAQRAHVFARVSPADKLRIVRQLQHSGATVAMVGDGINDSPALRAADVGIAMGRRGAKAARDVADIVLRTDDLDALSLAIERGRSTQANVRKAVRYLIGTNLSEILVVLAATAAGMGAALTPMQLLWINLVSDILPGLGLTFEPPHPGLMRRPPEASDVGVVAGPELRSMAKDAGLLAGGALAACGWGLLRHGNSPQARSMTFLSLVLAQLLHARNCRGEAGSRAVRPRPANRQLDGALGASFALQIGALLIPALRNRLGVVPMDAADTAATIAAGTLPYLLGRS